LIGVAKLINNYNNMDQIIQSNKKNILIYVILAVLIGLSLGYYCGVNKAEEPREAMLQEIFGNALFANNLSGEILEIASDKKSLTIEVSGIYGVNLPKDYQKKQILINEDTKIVLRAKKDTVIFEKETSELQEKGEMAMPLPYIEKEIKAGALIIGDTLSFNFLQNKDTNILSTQFVAIQINVSR